MICSLFASCAAAHSESSRHRPPIADAGAVPTATGTAGSLAQDAAGVDLGSAGMIAFMIDAGTSSDAGCAPTSGSPQNCRCGSINDDIRYYEYTRDAIARGIAKAGASRGAGFDAGEVTDDDAGVDADFTCPSFDRALSTFIDPPNGTPYCGSPEPVVDGVGQIVACRYAFVVFLYVR